MKKLSLISFIVVSCLLCMAVSAYAGKDLLITWDSNTEKDLLGYRLYQTYISLDGLTNSTTEIYDGTQTSYNFTVTVPGHYHFVGTAYNADGESEYSNEEYYLHEVPNPPIANAGSTAIVNAGQLVLLNGSGSTGTGTLTYLWSKLVGPSFTIVNPTNVIAQFTAPSVSAVTTIIMKLKVSDEQGQDSYSTKVVRVNPISSNEKPVANAGSDQMAAKFSTVTLNSSLSTDDNAITNRVWKKLYGGAITLSDVNAVSPTFNASVGIYIFSVTVYDAEGESSADTVVIRALF